jgi:outer membrane protein assembly factor BamB
MRRWIFLLAALLALAVGGAALAVFFYDREATQDVRGSSETEFVVTDEPGEPVEPVPPAEPGTTIAPPQEVETEPWPTYGYEARRTRFAPEIRLRPPFRQIWMVRGRQLIEFPPVVAYDRLYVGTNPGRFLAVDAETGDIVWEKDFDRCIAASPAVADGILYQPLMMAVPCGNPDRSSRGFLVALDADTGVELWRFEAGVIESSPLLVDGLLYFGSWDRKLYALDTATQRLVWTFETGDEIKGAPAYANGTVFIASYDGRVYAVDAKTGEERWSAGAQSGLGGAGNFYSTPAVAYGRVFIGNTDGKVYAFGARSGNLLWAKSTGGFVYSSPAVWQQTIYIGSYDEKFYALDAATGDVRWAFEAGGQISGSPTVIDGVVYFSTLEARTVALDARTGEQLWSFPDGKYSPLVADEERAYLVGYTRLYGLVPDEP